MSRLTQEQVKSAPQTARKIYLAAGWFSPGQMERMNKTLEVLREWEVARQGREIYAPYYDLLCPPDADDETRDKIYNTNVEKAAEADVIVAVTDEKDIGTLFELGYAACARDMCAVAPHPLLVGCAYTLGDRPFNLMLAKGLDVVCKTYGELRDFLLRSIVPQNQNQVE